MGTPNSEQAEKLTEIGGKLKRVRCEKAISLEQVAAKTMINTRLLSAIEEGALDQLPEPVYTQGFIRRFADALGMNGEELAKAYPIKPISTDTNHQEAQKLNIQAGQLRPVHLLALVSQCPRRLAQPSETLSQRRLLRLSPLPQPHLRLSVLLVQPSSWRWQSVSPLGWQ
jgi:transcriptional regulator with XRE-family HTH domain